MQYSFSQEAALNKVAQKVCDYMKTDEYKAMDKQEKTMKMGFKMIEFYGTFRDEFDEDAISTFNEEAGRKLGEKIGLRMATICPNELMEMAAEYMDEDEDEDSSITMEEEEEEVEETVINSVEGNITAIENDVLTYISVKDTKGKTHKILITEKFDGVDVINKSNLRKDVSLDFIEQQFYDLSERDYVYKKVLKSITLK